jgi:hypothetical protein
MPEATQEGFTEKLGAPPHVSNRNRKRKAVRGRSTSPFRERPSIAVSGVSRIRPRGSRAQRFN